MATPSATGCCRPWRGACGAACAAATRCRASVATNSPLCCRRWRAAMPPSPSARSWWARCANRWPWTTRGCPPRPAPAWRSTPRRAPPPARSSATRTSPCITPRARAAMRVVCSARKCTNGSPPASAWSAPCAKRWTRARSRCITSHRLISPIGPSWAWRRSLVGAVATAAWWKPTSSCPLPRRPASSAASTRWCSRLRSRRWPRGAPPATALAGWP